MHAGYGVQFIVYIVLATVLAVADLCSLTVRSTAVCIVIEVIDDCNRLRSTESSNPSQRSQCSWPPERFQSPLDPRLSLTSKIRISVPKKIRFFRGFFAMTLARTKFISRLIVN